MAKNLLVINVDIRETRVALIENGIIAELHLERESSTGTLGNIYLGKVSRVLPGMQAAFIDVGLERAAFLHVEDLIRPDDFEAYLAGRHKPGDVDRRRTTAGGTAAGVDEGIGHGAEDLEAAALQEAADAADAAEAARADAEVEIDLPTALDVLDVVGGTSGVDAISPDAGQEDDDDLDAVEPRYRDDELAANGGEGDQVDVDVDALGSDPGETRQAADQNENENENDSGDLEVDVDVDVDSDEPSAEEVAAVRAEAAGFEASPTLTDAAGQEIAVAGEAITISGEAEPSAVARSGTRQRRGRVRRSARTRDRQAAPAVEGAVAEGVPAAAGPMPQRTATTEAREGGRREGRGREGRGREGREPKGRDGGRDGRGQKARGGGGGGTSATGPRRTSNEPARISKTTPIRDVVREGQEVIVQISKEPIGTKGARVTSHVSLPGRYVVYLPTVDHVGISKRIGSEKERSRLRESIESMKPPQGGLIVRTLAEGLTKKQLKADVGYLVRLWGEIVKKREAGHRAPEVLYAELDLVLRTARDLFTDDIEKIVIDDREEYVRLKRFVEMFMPERADAVELYEGEEPIFDAYGIEDEIQRALSRKVPLPSGGHLIIDQAEALTAIDVNTGRFVGKGSKDLEETILTTNLEAVEEIAYQLRFRNIGGLIILDLIDMERAQNREKVRRRMEDLLSKDKAKTTLNRISELGLIEMTRKRTRESLGRMILEPCFYCDGTGQVQSKQTIAYEILRQIRRERMNLPGYSIVVNAHPAVIDLLKNDERVAVQEAERLFTRRLELVPRKEYHLEQFDLQGR